VVAHDEGGANILDGPRWREAAGGHYPPLAEWAVGSGESVVSFPRFTTRTPNFPAAPDPRGGFSLERFLDRPRRREAAGRHRLHSLSNCDLKMLNLIHSSDINRPRGF
jgi:hypothetical protein